MDRNDQNSRMSKPVEHKVGTLQSKISLFTHTPIRTNRSKLFSKIKNSLYFGIDKVSNSIPHVGFDKLIGLIQSHFQKLREI